MKQRDKEQQLLLLQSWKTDNYIGSKYILEGAIYKWEDILIQMAGRGGGIFIRGRGGHYKKDTHT